MAMGSREDVVAEARSWCHTPYHHRARVKGAGVDCGLLLIAVYSACGVIEDFTPRKYSRDFHFHRDEEWYRDYVETWAVPVDEPQPGDVALFKLGRLYSHGAIVTGWPTVVQALAQEGVCMENDYRETRLFDCPVLFYNPWGRML